ncbi:MAG: hypothetical protein ACPIOQ_04340 [Promethearchaeia archaeon]
MSARGRPGEKPEAKAANRPRIEGPAPRARSSGSDADEVRTAATVSSAAYSNIEVEYIARIGKGYAFRGLRTGEGADEFFSSPKNETTIGHVALDSCALAAPWDAGPRGSERVAYLRHRKPLSRPEL